MYADWDDLTDLDIIAWKKQMDKGMNKNIDKKGIDKGMNKGGFSPNTEIKLWNGTCKQIKDILIGDVLEHGEKVYGKVEIDGMYLTKNDSKNFSQTGTKEHLLYHLLTNNKYFYVKNNIKVYDYDAFIDL